MWHVIQEHPGREPEIVAESASYETASALVFQVVEANKLMRGTKVYLQKADSADQLQVTKRGKVHRDQPELPAIGEDVTVLVPTATARGAVLL